MVDFHTHILPGIDDGSQDESMTTDLIREERKQGVDHIVATPHFYADEMSVESFLEKRSQAMEKASRIASGSPKITAGAEVYYFPGIGQGRQVDRLCIEGTQTLLLEMPFSQWTKEVQNDVEDLIYRRSFTIVLAHIERYFHFQKNRDTWNSVLALPVYAQINGGSFLRKRRLFGPDPVQKFSLDYLRNHPGGVILGSDCHNTTTRRPNLARARQAIASALGEETLLSLDEAAASALS